MTADYDHSTDPAAPRGIAEDRPLPGYVEAEFEASLTRVVIPLYRPAALDFLVTGS